MHNLKEYGWRHHLRRSSSNIGKGPKNYHRSYEKIKEEVCEALLWDPQVDATDIEVIVKENRVTLKGLVDSRHAKVRAEAVVDSIAGVEDVFNLLRIKPRLDLDSDKIITRGDDGFFSEETIHR